MSEIPRWGRVTAGANEFLIQLRNGKVVRAGQGLSCFKWPADSVTIVPTSIARLAFVADQVSIEKVGIEVRGLAVYRIAEPLLAYRMVDLDRTTLTEILRDMFVGATRRIVASLTLDACLRHRKEEIAAALMAEIAPVLAGEGATFDTNDAGWGVVIDTIEIQDVRVLSTEVFERLQAPYREKLALESLVAEERVFEERARIEQGRRRTDEALEAELARARRKAEADRERAAVELAARREAGEVEAALLSASRAAYGDLSEARLREIMITETMPELARAFRASFDKVHLTAGSGSDVLGALSAGMDHLLAATKKGPGP